MSAGHIEDVPPLASYPYQVTLPSRYTDVDASGGIGHIGLSRYHEEVRTAFARQLIKSHGGDSKQWNAFLGRVTTDIFGRGRYPDPLSFGAGTFNIGERSYGIEVSTFQDGVPLARARALSVAVDADHKSTSIRDETRRILGTAMLQAGEWWFSGKPGPERQELHSYPHRWELSTRFADTDAMGHLNNVALLRYCEEGRAALLVRAQPAAPDLGTVTQVDISFLREGRFMQDMTIGSTVQSVTGTQVRLTQGLFQREKCVATCDCVMNVSEQTAQRLSSL